MKKLKRRAFTAEFKIEAVKLVTENGLSYAEVGRRLDVRAPTFVHRLLVTTAIRETIL
jgi:transposase-like protein